MERVPEAAEAAATRVQLSPEARAALAPVTASEAAPAGEDALHREEGEAEGADAATQEPGTAGQLRELTAEEKAQVSALRARDLEVRAHEAAHISASGGLAGGASFTYQEGPDGQRYAIGGEVPISAPGSRDPRQALMNAERMRAAALAPASPSSQDQAVAAQAAAMAAQARAALAREVRPPPEDTERATDPRGQGGETPTDEVGTSGYDVPVEPARLGGPSDFGPTQHLHSDGCGYCSTSAARFRG